MKRGNKYTSSTATIYSGLLHKVLYKITAVVVNVEIYKICTKHIKSMRENMSSIRVNRDVWLYTGTFALSRLWLATLLVDVKQEYIPSSSRSMIGGSQQLRALALNAGPRTVREIANQLLWMCVLMFACLAMAERCGNREALCWVGGIPEMCRKWEAHRRIDLPWFEFEMWQTNIRGKLSRKRHRQRIITHANSNSFDFTYYFLPKFTDSSSSHPLMAHVLLT